MAARVSKKASVVNNITQETSSTPDLLHLLPKDVFALSSFKALKKLSSSVLAVTLGVVALIYLPWYLLPLGWIFLGTATTGLFAVGYACGQNMFFRNRVINYIVGTICMLPLMYPYEYWKSHSHEISETVAKFYSRVANSPLWFLSSVFQWGQSNFTFDFSKRMVASGVVLYIFVAIFFPLMTYGIGIWGLFKYYIIPLLVYHFWMSTYLKANVMSVFSDSPVLWEYPQWVQLLSNDLNYGFSFLQSQLSSKSIPSYKWKDAVKSLKKKQKVAELYFGSDLFITEKFRSKVKSRSGRKVNSEGLSVKKVIEFLGTIYWSTTLFMAAVHILGIYGILTNPFILNTYILAVIWYYIAGFGITTGYHRLFSHRSYDAVFPVRVFFVLLGTSAMQMSCLEWCKDHRAHHRFTDTDKDPYNAKRGFWWSHIGWLVFKRTEEPHSDISDLEKDWFLRWQHKWFAPLGILLAFVLPTWIAGHYWGDWRGGFLIASCASKIAAYQCTFFINSMAHMIGEATYSDQRSPRDSWITSIFTWGEGYHNYHHEFPYDYRNGVKLLSYDPGKWMVYTFSLFGLTYNLKRFPNEVVEKGKIQMQQKLIERKKLQYFWGKPIEELPEMTQKEFDNSVRQCHASLIIIDDIVYDVTKFAPEHPAGEKLIRAYIGKDATNAFNGSVYNHSVAARNILDTLRVAKLKSDDEQEN